MKYKKISKGTIGRVCKKCRAAISEKSLYDYCPECYKKIEAVFDKIRTYLEECPGATAFEISQETGVPYHVVNNFVKDGRLVEIPNEYLNMECKRCGCLILSANSQYCPSCRQEMEKEMELAKKELRKSIYGDAKMYMSHRRNH